MEHEFSCYVYEKMIHRIIFLVRGTSRKEIRDAYT